MIVDIKELINNDELLEVGRKAIEDVLVDMRDSRIFILRNNGLVIKEKDGSLSSIIRLSSEAAIKIALRAIESHLMEISIK